MKIDRYSILAVSIAAIFVLTAIDAYQDLWSLKNIAKSSARIFLISVFATAPVFIFFLISKYTKKRGTKLYSFLLASILAVVSLFAWSAGVLSGSAPKAAGAQQMHLILWPVVIPVISLVLFAFSVIVMLIYRRLVPGITGQGD